MPSAVLPAAGASRRMGRSKLLLPYGTGTIVGSLLESLRAAGVRPIALVTAPGDEELRGWARESRVDGLVVGINPEPWRGMLSTIQAGITTLGGGVELARAGEVLLVSPADLPELRPETVVELLRRRAAAGAPLAVPVCGGRRGHPLAIAPALIPEIGTLDPRVGLRELLDRYAAEVLEVAVGDPGAVRDVDTPEDYRRLTGV